MFSNNMYEEDYNYDLDEFWFEKYADSNMDTVKGLLKTISEYVEAQGSTTFCLENSGDDSVTLLAEESHLVVASFSGCNLSMEVLIECLTRLGVTIDYGPDVSIRLKAWIDEQSSQLNTAVPDTCFVILSDNEVRYVPRKLYNQACEAGELFKHTIGFHTNALKISSVVNGFDLPDEVKPLCTRLNVAADEVHFTLRDVPLGEGAGKFLLVFNPGDIAVAEVSYADENSRTVLEMVLNCKYMMQIGENIT